MRPSLDRIDWLTVLDEVRAIAQTGLHYATDPYDRERCTRLLDLATRGYAEALDLPEPEVRARLARDLGYVSAKVGADAAIFDDEGRGPAGPPLGRPPVGPDRGLGRARRVTRRDGRARGRGGGGAPGDGDDAARRDRPTGQRRVRAPWARRDRLPVRGRARDRSRSPTRRSTPRTATSRTWTGGTRTTSDSRGMARDALARPARVIRSSVVASGAGRTEARRALSRRADRPPLVAGLERDLGLGAHDRGIGAAGLGEHHHRRLTRAHRRDRDLADLGGVLPPSERGEILGHLRGGLREARRCQRLPRRGHVRPGRGALARRHRGRRRARRRRRRPAALRGRTVAAARSEREHAHGGAAHRGPDDASRTPSS